MTHINSSSAFSLDLSTLIKGENLLLSEARCTFSYYWNANEKEGQAQLLGINGSMLAITLYPEEKDIYLLFSSDIKPISYSIQSHTVVIKQVELMVSVNREYSAKIFLNDDGSVVQGSENLIKNGQN